MKNERLLRILLSPHISEKTSRIMEKHGDYVFQVRKDATKPDIKLAVEQLFKTQVVSVRIVNVKSKPKRFGKVEGRSKAWKKAYVTLQPGQRIDFSGEQ